MVDFDNQTRKRCRNPKCRKKLPEPVTNEREAFCCKGCHQSFYLHRCLVCEKAIERTTANRKICKRSKCRNALKAGAGFGREQFHQYSAVAPRNVCRDVSARQLSIAAPQDLADYLDQRIEAARKEREQLRRSA